MYGISPTWGPWAPWGVSTSNGGDTYIGTYPHAVNTLFIASLRAMTNRILLLADNTLGLGAYAPCLGIAHNTP